MPPAVGSQTARSLGYGLRLLGLFSTEHPVRGIAELAELLGVSRPTAHRYATTCLELGYLEQAPLRRYRLARRPPVPRIAIVGTPPLAQHGRADAAKKGAKEGAGKAGAEEESKAKSAKARLRRGRSQSLERGLAVLSCFTAQTSALGAAAISRRLGLSRSTTYRYLAALTALGCLRRDVRGRYRLAPGAAKLGWRPGAGQAQSQVDVCERPLKA